MNLLLAELLVFAFAFSGLGANLFVVLLEGSQVLTGFRELAFFHALTDIPVHEGTLGVHQIELVVNAREHFGDGAGVRDHAHGTLDTGEVAAWHDGWWLVIDTALEARWAPVDELDGALGLDGGDSGVDILWHNITAVHQASGHVLAVAWVALGHHRGWLEGAVGDLSHRQLLVVGLLSRDDWGVRAEHEVDAWVWHQVGLEFRHIDVERAIETERRRQRRDDLGDQTVQVRVRWTLNVERAATDVVDSFVVEHDGDIGVLQQGVRREHRVVWLNDGSRHLWRWVDGEAELALAASTDRRSKRSEPRPEPARAVVGQLADAIEDEVHDFLADRVVATRVVVGSIFLARDDLLWVVELTVRARADFIANRRLQIDEHGTWHMLAGARLGEESREGIVGAVHGRVARHLAIRLDAVLQAVELPAGIADLNTALAQVDGKDFTHLDGGVEEAESKRGWRRRSCGGREKTL
ncbi:TPA: LOW QUALITY PROTEIN: hypothetical protein N0F65_005282 [Lagenidium giganteum]|uniref:Secreted protein n=1 Tax=Lagenidium giganteum TaxID=4803 RepID=A0AAV2YWP2_9STRA|nr:TPA: LOW QUALITY PROTEIN: hypothetical protein N0F65_005282 [Lagenidium giganteum]